MGEMKWPGNFTARLKSILGLLTGEVERATAAEKELETKIQAATGDLSNYLPLAGGTMTGNLNMDFKSISNVGDPTETGDAANKNYVDEAVNTEATRAKAAESANATAITMVQQGLDTEESTRANADTALENKIEALKTSIAASTSNFVIYPTGSADNFSSDDSGNLTVNAVVSAKTSDNTNVSIEAATYNNTTGNTRAVYVVKDGVISSVNDNTDIEQNTHILAWVDGESVIWPSSSGGGTGDVTKEELNAAINSEASARQTADANLQSQIDANTTAINQNASNITAETERATAVEKTLMTAHNNLEKNVADNVELLQEADAALEKKITDITSTVMTTDEYIKNMTIITSVGKSSSYALVGFIGYNPSNAAGQIHMGSTTIDGVVYRLYADISSGGHPRLAYSELPRGEEAIVYITDIDGNWTNTKYLYFAAESACNHLKIPFCVINNSGTSSSDVTFVRYL